MNQPSIGFYVHYHGMGHKHRAECILQHLTLPATVVTSNLDRLSWNGPTLKEVVAIACDNDDLNEVGLDRAGDSPGLHFAPLWSTNITERVAQYTAWLNTAQPDLVMIDVSAEIAMLTRLASIPSVVMRQHGDRNDDAHQIAYHAAHSLLAPFPERMEDDITPDWVRDKTVYLDGFCRHSEPTCETSMSFESPTIAVMFGRGGTDLTVEQLCEAARSIPDHQWIVIGKDAPAAHPLPTNLQFVGWIQDPVAYLTAADLVVTAAGHNSVMEVGHSGCRFIAVAQDRPFEEQTRKARILDREGLAVGVESWPSAEQWPTLVARAKHLDPTQWQSVFQNDGAVQAANHLAKVALWSRDQRVSGERISL
ncbi:Predicted glycosyl transferase [Neorhodopirellula lusitana]|uniref:Predicted glycosyl transferase n=1 Tax=Neorhodopirellula lusitana TaxID=445327 RepID=A0ABY1QMC0_9BACT|nr:glycosyltransferase [Neorhodopirellula lusitana]SMP75485.1 Predicted glycosyl transferase [Neorhodopirellula lusitana]